MSLYSFKLIAEGTWQGCWLVARSYLKLISQDLVTNWNLNDKQNTSSLSYKIRSRITLNKITSANIRLLMRNEVVIGNKLASFYELAKQNNSFCEIAKKSA